MMQLSCKSRVLDLRQPCVMGVLNITPDSFSDGGQFIDLNAAVEQAQRMAEAGAAIIDIGGESTRPGAEDVTEAEELRRVIPVIERLNDLSAVISIDTSKARVMREACAAGAGMINDVRALREPQALAEAAQTGAAICLMHMQGQPRTMQQQPEYRDVVSEVREFLLARLAVCKAAGIPEERLLVDPGFGFGKSLAHNLQLLGQLTTLTALGRPVVVGLSRKSMLGALTGLPTGQRGNAGIAAAVLAVWQGARVVRTHDVAATVEALKVVTATVPYQLNQQGTQT